MGRPCSVRGCDQDNVLGPLDWEGQAGDVRLGKEGSSDASGEKWLPVAQRDECEPQKHSPDSTRQKERVEMMKCIGLGHPKKVGAFTGRPIEGRECGSKRGPSGHAEGKGLVVFTWRLQEAGMELREVRWAGHPDEGVAGLGMSYGSMGGGESLRDGWEDISVL